MMTSKLQTTSSCNDHSNDPSIIRLVKELANDINEFLLAEYKYKQNVKKLFIFFMYKCKSKDNYQQINWLECVRLFHYKIIIPMIKFALNNNPSNLVEDVKSHVSTTIPRNYKYKKICHHHIQLYIEILQEIVDQDKDIKHDIQNLKDNEKDYVTYFRQKVITISIENKNEIKAYIEIQSQKAPTKTCLPSQQQRRYKKRKRPDANSNDSKCYNPTNPRCEK